MINKKLPFKGRILDVVGLENSFLFAVINKSDKLKLCKINEIGKSVDTNITTNYHAFDFNCFSFHYKLECPIISLNGGNNRRTFLLNEKGATPIELNEVEYSSMIKFNEIYGFNRRVVYRTKNYLCCARYELTQQQRYMLPLSVMEHIDKNQFNLINFSSGTITGFDLNFNIQYCAINSQETMFLVCNDTNFIIMDI